MILTRAEFKEMFAADVEDKLICMRAVKDPYLPIGETNYIVTDYDSNTVSLCVVRSREDILEFYWNLIK